MNLILLPSTETRTIPAGTQSAKHLLETLHAEVGSTFWCGEKNGRRGLAKISEISPLGEISFSVEWEKGVQLSLPPVNLLVGLSRPQTMKKIFATAAELGCRNINVFFSEKSDPSYAQSSLWKTEDSTLCEIFEKAAEQTCVPAMPAFSKFDSLKDFFEKKPRGNAETRVALDVYAAKVSFGGINLPKGSEITLAIGSERGWTNAERDLLRAENFVFAHLGERVLRVETAVAAGISVALSKTNFWEKPHCPLAS